MYLGRVVEMGPTQAVISSPLHPYTQALIAAVPVPDPDVRRQEPRIRRRRSFSGPYPAGLPVPSVARGAAGGARGAPDDEPVPGHLTECWLYV